MKPGLKIPVLVLVCLIAGTGILAQDTSLYRPLRNDPALVHQLTEATSLQYKKMLGNISGAHKKQLERIYRNRYYKILGMLAEGDILAEEKTNRYLMLLAKELIDNNPALHDLETRFVFSRSWEPNAGSTGEGTIIFNIGLFNRLHNESQAAFILSHELAHYYLRHSDTSMLLHLNNVNVSSQAYRDRMKRSKKNDSSTNKRDSFYLNLAYLESRHNRKEEFEADSLALEWLKNTSFDVREAITALALLDSVDRDKYDTDPGLDQVFQFKEHPFQAQWISQEENTYEFRRPDHVEFYNFLDSLKTHPDCISRINRLAGRVAKYHKRNSKTFVVNEEAFKKIQRAFDYEVIESCFRQGNISRSLYLSLQMLAIHRSDAYLVMNTGRCLNEIYKARKVSKNRLLKIAGIQSNSNDKKYNKLIGFINQVPLSDLAAISYFYLLVHQEKLSIHEDFLEALITSKINFNKPEERKYWVEQYEKQFPNGRYKF